MILPLITIGGTKLIQLINSKIENQKSAKLLSDATTVVTNAVRCVFQTYVEALKNKNAFDPEAQKKAFEMTYQSVLAILSKDAQEYLTEAVGDLNAYIVKSIEA